MSDRPPPLVPGEIAWRCDLVRLGDDRRVVEQATLDQAGLAMLKPHARRLYLDVVEVEGQTWLVHRAGWPFDLRVAEVDPTGREATRLRPTGAGDEVMRDLLESFEAAAAGYSLHVHDQQSG